MGKIIYITEAQKDFLRRNRKSLMEIANGGAAIETTAEPNPTTGKVDIDSLRKQKRDNTAAGIPDAPIKVDADTVEEGVYFTKKEIKEAYLKKLIKESKKYSKKSFIRTINSK